MNLKRTLYFLSETLICFVTANSCSPYRLGNSENYQNQIIPPNCIEISDNFFVDKSDIKNIDYLEFMFWNERIFGSNSMEFHFILPDTVRNNLPDSSYHGMISQFYGSMITEELDRPLENISDEQFKTYTDWRTDRVYEMLLCRFGLMDYDTAQRADHYFSINNYYNGSFIMVKPDTVLAYAPVFRIPTAEEELKIQQNNSFLTGSKAPWLGYRNVCEWVKIGH